MSGGGEGIHGTRSGGWQGRHCRPMTKGVVLESLLVRSATGENPKMPVTAVDGPATDCVCGVASRHGLSAPPLGRITSAAGLRRLLILLVPDVVEPIQLPRLNCCTGRSSMSLYEQ